MNRCECGCGQLCGRRFVSGHNLPRAPNDGLTYDQRAYRKDRERRLAESKAYGQKHRERRCRYARAYHAAHKAEANARRITRSRANRKKENERKRKWMRANPEKVRAYNKRYAAKDPDRFRANVANANHRRRAQGGGVSAWQWRRIRNEFGGRCAYCACKPPHLQQEHVDPLVLGGAHEPYNVVPACARCNGSKNSRTLLLWIAQFGMPT